MNNDAELLEQLRSGNAEAYEILFKKYYKLLTIQAYYLLDEEMDAEDVVQNLLIDLWEKKLYFNIKTSIKAYLQMSVRNNCLKLIKNKKSEAKRLYDLTYLMEYKTSEESPEQQEEVNTEINTVMNLLPERRLKVLNLVYIENKKYKDAAEEMGISINSIKTHLRLAMKSLRQQFGNMNP